MPQFKSLNEFPKVYTIAETHTSDPSTNQDFYSAHHYIVFSTLENAKAYIAQSIDGIKQHIAVSSDDNNELRESIDIQGNTVITFRYFAPLDRESKTLTRITQEWKIIANPFV
jgi:hypothetical protein